jgi:D-arabinose 1-dehydrogenase-like Zn-dependent alcohol dehydrogenase
MAAPGVGDDFQDLVSSCIREYLTPHDNDGEVLIRVDGCCVCHSDALMVEGQLPSLQYLRVPNHEVIGVLKKPLAPMS